MLFHSDDAFTNEKDAARQNGMAVVEISLGRDAVVCRREAAFGSESESGRFFPLAKFRPHTNTNEPGIYWSIFLGIVYTSSAGRNSSKQTHKVKIKWGCLAFRGRLRRCLSNFINIQSRSKVIPSHYSVEWLQIHHFRGILCGLLNVIAINSHPFPKWL